MEDFLKKKLDLRGQFLSQEKDISANGWQAQMHYSQIEKIQKNCKIAMEKWGYKTFKYEDVHPNRALLPLDKT